MKLLAVNSARSIWLIRTALFNPGGLSLIPVVEGLVERYRFSRFPQAAALAVQPTDLKFERGEFKGANGVPLMVNLSVFEDGLIVETRASTDESERFFEDALTWVEVEYGLTHYSKLNIEKLYASELTVEIESPLSAFSGGFFGFSDRMKRGISNNPGTPMELVSVSFGPDPTQTRKAAPFKIERLANSSFDRKEYYSAAPVPTSEHLKLLQEFERFASAKRS